MLMILPVCVCIRCVHTFKLFTYFDPSRWQGSFLGLPATTNNVIHTFKQIHGNYNDKATKQGFDLLNDDKQSFCMCGTNWSIILWRSLQNKNVKFPRQRDPIATNLYFSIFTLRTVRINAVTQYFARFCSSWTSLNDCKIIQAQLTFSLHSRRCCYCL